MIAELPCFLPIISAVRGDHGMRLQQQAVELCTASLEIEVISVAERGTCLAYVGTEMTLHLIGALATSLEPLAAAASAEEEEEEAEGSACSVMSALVGLSGSLLSKASSIIAQGSNSPPEALALMRLLVTSCGHPKQHICEVRMEEV